MTQGAVEIETTPPATEEGQREVAEAIEDRKAGLAEAEKKQEARKELFRSLADYLKCEEIETDGAWFRIPGWPANARVKLAHVSNAHSKMRELEAAYRANEKLAETDALPDHIDEQMSRAAMWGTAVKELEIPNAEGGLEPSTKETFDQLMKVRRFRIWLFAVTARVYEAWVAQQERDRGNLSPVSAG